MKSLLTIATVSAQYQYRGRVPCNDQEYYPQNGFEQRGVESRGALFNDQGYNCEPQQISNQRQMPTQIITQQPIDQFQPPC